MSKNKKMEKKEEDPVSNDDTLTKRDKFRLREIIQHISIEIERRANLFPDDKLQKKQNSHKDSINEIYDLIVGNPEIIKNMEMGQLRSMYVRFKEIETREEFEQKYKSAQKKGAPSDKKKVMEHFDKIKRNFKQMIN